jgi:hypothetical protein
LYWQYFVTGLILYGVTRMIYIYMDRKQKNQLGEQKKNEDFKTPDQRKFTKQFNNEYFLYS